MSKKTAQTEFPGKLKEHPQPKTISTNSPNKKELTRKNVAPFVGIIWGTILSIPLWAIIFKIASGNKSGNKSSWRNNQ